MRTEGRDDGISSLHSHQDSLADEGVTEEIKRQTFAKGLTSAQIVLRNSF